MLLYARVDAIDRKKRAKLLLFFELTKYFGNFFTKKCIFSPKVLRFRRSPFAFHHFFVLL